MITKDGPVGFVGVGLHLTPDLRVVKRPVEIWNVKKNGTENNATHGIKIIPIILGPITYKRNLIQ